MVEIGLNGPGLNAAIGGVGIGIGVGLGYLGYAVFRLARSRELHAVRQIGEYRTRVLEALKDKVKPEELPKYVDTVVPLPVAYEHSDTNYQQIKLRAVEVLRDKIEDPQDLERTVSGIFP